MKKLLIISLFVVIAAIMPLNAFAQCDNGDCNITITGNDSGNNGWNGGAGISIYQDTTYIGFFTVTGSTYTQTFSICPGPVSFVWNSGTSDEECSFTILDSVGSTLYSTSSAANLYGLFADRDACPTCTRPYDINISNITGNSALVTWTYDTVTPPDFFTIYITDTANGTPVEIYINPLDDGNEYQYLLTGLTQTTTYLLTIQTTCPDDTSLTVHRYFTTNCYSGGTITVGEGSAISSDLPVNPSYPYSLGQMIFEESEFSNTDSIFGIRFFVTTQGINAARSIDVYIDTTTVNAYHSTNGLIEMPVSKRYFTGTHTITSGWNVITFQNAYLYPGSGNIVLTLDDNSGSTNNSIQIQASTTTNSMCLFAADDNANINPASASSLNSSLDELDTSVIRPNIGFVTPCNDATCLPPNIISATPTEYSVTLHWLPIGAETSFSVEYALAGTTNWITVYPSTSNTTVTINNLASATNYIFRISSLCDIGSAFDTISCATVCAPKTVPFYEDFEQFTATSSNSDIEACWARGTNNTSGYGPYINGTNSGHNSTNSMVFSGNSSFLALPELNVPVDSLSITFFFKGSSYYTHEVTVGVLTDQNNINSFTAIESIQYNGTGNDWQEVSVDLDAYTGTGVYIAIANLSTSYGSFNVDDITVNYINSCRKVSNATITSTTQNSATLSFTGVNGASNYTIFYGTGSTLASATDSTTSYTTTKTITGLMPATRYYSWIRTNCGTNHSGIAVGPVFSTTCPTVQVTDENPWIEDFESGVLDVCINNLRVNGSTDWQVVTPSTNPSTAYSGSHMARFASAAGNSTAITTLVTPSLNLSALSNGAELSFCTYINDADFDSINSLGVYYRTSNNGNWNLIQTYATATDEWTKYFITLPASNGAQSYQIGFRGNNPNAMGICIDDINVHSLPDCLRPSQITSSTTDNRATLHWTGSTSSYRFEYRKKGTSAWNIIDVDVDSVVVTGLSQNTEYQARIRSNCIGVGISEWSDVVSFHTNICSNHETRVNYNNSMMATTSTHSPFYTPQASNYSEIIVDGSYLNGLSNISSIAFRPMNADYGTHFSDCVIFFGHTNNNSLSSFLFDSNTFVPVYTGSLNFSDTGWHYVNLDADYAWNGQGNLVVGFQRNSDFYSGNTEFAAHSSGSSKVYYASTSNTTINPADANSLSEKGSSIFTPDLMFNNCLPSCSEPIINYTNADYQSVTIGFFSEGEQQQLQYKEQSANNWNDAINISNQHSGNQSYTLSGLSPMTEYNMRIRQVCPFDENGFSDWTDFTVITDTACTTPTNLHVVSNNSDEATFEWTSDSQQNYWELHVTSDNYYQIFPVTSNPATINGLPNGKDYTVYVRALCGQYHNSYSGFSNTATFSNKCANVRSVHAVATGTSVRVYWTAGSGNQEWLVSYGNVGFTVESMLGMVVADTTSVVITGLQPQKSYGFRVMSVCGDGWFGDWSSETVVYTQGNNDIDNPQDNTPSVTITPNPATGSTTLIINGINGELTISVIDLNGRTLYNNTLHCESENCSTSLDINDLPQGSYFVRISNENTNIVRKLIVK